MASKKRRRRISKKTKEKIGRVLYTIVLTIFALVLIMVAVIGLSDWKKYLVAYENAQSDAVIASYMDNLRDTRWKQQVAEAVSRMEHPFQSDEECEEIINRMLGEKLQYSQAPGSTEDRILYNVYCNGNPVGQFLLFTPRTVSSETLPIGRMAAYVALVK